MEDLQALWQKATRTENTSLDRKALEKLTSRKSSDELAKFRKVIQYEYYLTLAMFPVVAVAGYFYFDNLLVYLILTLFFVSCLYFYHRSLNTLKQIHVEDSMQNYLQKVISFLKQYVRHYITLCWTGSAVGLVIGFSWTFEAGHELGEKYAMQESQSEGMPVSPFTSTDVFHFIVLCLGIAFVVVSVCVAIHYYIKYLYSDRIKRLEQALSDLG